MSERDDRWTFDITAREHMQKHLDNIDAKQQQLAHDFTVLMNRLNAHDTADVRATSRIERIESALFDRDGNSRVARVETALFDEKGGSKLDDVLDILRISKGGGRFLLWLSAVASGWLAAFLQWKAGR